MALISAESLERVKGAADIVEVISQHTDLRRAGARCGAFSSHPSCS